MSAKFGVTCIVLLFTLRIILSLASIYLKAGWSCQVCDINFLLKIHLVDLCFIYTWYVQRFLKVHPSPLLPNGREVSGKAGACY